MPFVEEMVKSKADASLRTAELVGEAGSMPGSSGFTMACFHADKVPLGTKLYIIPARQLIPTRLTAFRRAVQRNYPPSILGLHVSP